MGPGSTGKAVGKPYENLWIKTGTESNLAVFLGSRHPENGQAREQGRLRDASETVGQSTETENPFAWDVGQSVRCQLTG